MNLGVKLAAVVLIGVTPAFADSLPVTGYVTATWSGISGSGESGNGTNVWTYDSGTQDSSTLTFAPSYSLSGQFGGSTPLRLQLGQLQDYNAGNINHQQSPTASLTVNVVFTSPSGTVPLQFTLGVNEQLSGGQDSVVQLANADGVANSFVDSNGHRYNVTLEGFYGDSNGTGSPITSLTTDARSTSTAYLFADITSNPEPVSFVLMGTVGLLVAIAFRRKSKSSAV
jgi:hypothetical protein